MSNSPLNSTKTLVIRYISEPAGIRSSVARWKMAEQAVSRRGLFKCRLLVLVDRVDAEERERTVADLEAQVRHHLPRWSLIQVHALSPSRAEKSSLRRDIAHLVETVLSRIRDMREDPDYGDRATHLLWDDACPAWTAAGSVLWVLDGISWLPIGGSAWASPLPELGAGANLNTVLPVRFAKHRLPKGLIGSSEKMTRVRQQVQMFAPYTFPVLLLGETGTGKEALAQLIHEASRRSGPLVPVNGALLTPELGAAELFGAVKGAYTGLGEDRRGTIVQAEGGTFFLDELNSTPGAVQAKLLRALEQAPKGQILIEPVGADIRRGGSSGKPYTVNARLLTAAQSIDDIREDVLHRVAGLIIELPPLRDRPEDIPELGQHIIRELNAAPEYSLGLSEKPDRLTSEALEHLANCRWPGNVRQLQRVIRHAWVTARFEQKTAIMPHHFGDFEFGSSMSRTTSERAPVPGSRALPDAVRTPAGTLNLRQEVAALVEQRAREAHAVHPRNGAAAARRLGFGTKQQLDRYVSSIHQKAQRPVDDRGEDV